MESMEVVKIGPLTSKGTWSIVSVTPETNLDNEIIYHRRHEFCPHRPSDSSAVIVLVPLTSQAVNNLKLRS